jgi:hypothetical protein
MDMVPGANCLGLQELEQSQLRIRQQAGVNLLTFGSQTVLREHQLFTMLP